ncbi:hypothetical protein [Kibdelosporangium philippinense]|uniref:hypothetical protein n=1 Tax=Kibdelosporangium philippinense TaxID=211113 RepID=UPI003608A059
MTSLTPRRRPTALQCAEALRDPSTLLLEPAPPPKQRRSLAAAAALVGITTVTWLLLSGVGAEAPTIRPRPLFHRLSPPRLRPQPKPRPFPSRTKRQPLPVGATTRRPPNRGKARTKEKGNRVRTKISPRTESRSAADWTVALNWQVPVLSSSGQALD